MPELVIPESFQPALEKLRTLPRPVWDSLASAWEQGEGEFSSISELSPDEAEEITDAVSELFRVGDMYAMEIPDIATNIASALQEAKKFPATEIPPFEDRLKRVLVIKPLAISAKANALRVEYERRFCNARILTDARPIYVGKPSLQPDAVMITHTARIAYHDDTGKLREVDIMMDNDDLATFRDLIDRAGEKTKSMQAVFVAAKIQIVNP